MTRIDIINRLIEKYQYKAYLEIGVNAGDSIRGVNAETKIGVDPLKQCPEVTHEMTSDDFFEKNKRKFDIIFIDGLHTQEQVYKDFTNALKALKTGGTIVLHDCSPHSEYLQTVPPTCSEWTGDVWKAVVKIRSENCFLFFTVDTDYGVGVCIPSIYDEQMTPVSEDQLTWANLAANRKQWLNLISPEELLTFNHNMLGVV